MDGYIPTHLGFLLYGQVLTQSDLCDTIIVVSNGEIRCHSCVISMTSDRIREWLKISGVRDGKKILPMEAADLEAVYAVLKYIYTGNEVSQRFSNLIRYYMDFIVFATNF